MEVLDETTLDTVMKVVVRYGMKRTTMADIAREAGVSRQTLYDRYGDKDGIMAAAIESWGNRLNAEIKAAFDDAKSLSEVIEAYYKIAVYPTYETIQIMPDAADFEHGMGPVSVAATERLVVAKQDLLAKALEPSLPQNGPAASDVAAFFEQSSTKFKMSGVTRDELDRLLAVLKASTLALAKG